jgi:hypothetical protein
MLFGEKTAVYYDDHTKYTHTSCGQSTELYFEAGSVYSNHRPLKDQRDVSQRKNGIDLGAIGQDDQSSYFVTIYCKARIYKIHH